MCAFTDSLRLQRCCPLQRQAERIKRDKAQAKRGDDLDPHVSGDLIVPVARFQGSRLASGAVASPYEHNGRSTEKGSQAKKARVSSSDSSLSAAVVEAEISVEAQVLNLILFEKVLYIFMVSSESFRSFYRARENKE